MDQKSQLMVVDEKLSGLIEEKISACPKNFNKIRFLQNCSTVLKDIDKDKLAKCTPESIALTMVKGAFLGLDFFNRECYAIPFGNQLQFLTDYKGDIKLARQYSVKAIKNIYSRLVKEGDTFEAKVIDGMPVINYTPVAFSDTDIIGAFAVVVYEDNSLDYITMSKKEIEETRQNWSKCPTSKAWVKTPGEMYKKTVLKRLCKMIELNFDNVDQQEAFDAGGDLKRTAIDVAPEVGDPFDKPSEEAKTELPLGQEEPKETEQPAKSETTLIKEMKGEIEKHLESKGESATKIFKAAIECCKKPLLELNLEEMRSLKGYVIDGAI